MDIPGDGCSLLFRLAVGTTGTLYIGNVGDIPSVFMIRPTLGLALPSLSLQDFFLSFSPPLKHLTEFSFLLEILNRMPPPLEYLFTTVALDFFF